MLGSRRGCCLTGALTRLRAVTCRPLMTSYIPRVRRKRVVQRSLSVSWSSSPALPLRALVSCNVCAPVGTLATSWSRPACVAFMLPYSRHRVTITVFSACAGFLFLHKQLVRRVVNGRRSAQQAVQADFDCVMRSGYWHCACTVLQVGGCNARAWRS